MLGFGWATLAWPLWACAALLPLPALLCMLPHWASVVPFQGLYCAAVVLSVLTQIGGQLTWLSSGLPGSSGPYLALLWYMKLIWLSSGSLGTWRSSVAH
eukprot:scaffold198330_cov17-Tisochrysis_lutea.AAC.1